MPDEAGPKLAGMQQRKVPGAKGEIRLWTVNRSGILTRHRRPRLTRPKVKVLPNQCIRCRAGSGSHADDGSITEADSQVFPDLFQAT